MAGRQTRGRQRIPIRRIENLDDLYATFSKRRLGLYKKASELSTLCGVDVGVIIFSPTDNAFSFFHPTMDSVVERYRNPNQPVSDYTRLIEAHSRARIEQLNQRLDEVLVMKEQLKDKEKCLDEIDRTRLKGWWEQLPVESVDGDQVREWITWFQNLRVRVSNRIEEITNGAGASVSAAAFRQEGQQQQQQIIPDFSDMPIAGSSVFIPPSYDSPTMSSLYDLTGGLLGRSDLFQGQYGNVPLQGQYQPSIIGETGQFPSSYSQLPGPSSSTQVEDHQTGQMPGHYYNFPAGHPTQDQDLPDAGGGIERPIPSYYVFPETTSQAQPDPLHGSQNMGFSPNPFYYLPGPSQVQDSPRRGNDGVEFFGGAYGYFPQQDQNPGDGSGNGGSRRDGGGGGGSQSGHVG